MSVIQSRVCNVCRVRRSWVSRNRNRDCGIAFVQLRSSLELLRSGIQEGRNLRNIDAPFDSTSGDFKIYRDAVQRVSHIVCQPLEIRCTIAVTHDGQSLRSASSGAASTTARSGCGIGRCCAGVWTCSDTSSRVS